VDGGIGHILGVVDAAQKLMSLAIARLRGQGLMQQGACFIDAALL
jgi:hypothetical protein